MSEGKDWGAVRRRLAELEEQLERGSDDRQVLAERAARYRAAVSDGPAERGLEMVLFQRCGARYGVPITALSGIHRVAGITRLPGLSPVVKGLANVQGRLVAVHDIGSFAKASREPGDELWLLVDHGEAASVALLADAVDGVRRVSSDDLREPPLSLEAIRDCFTGFDADGVGYLSLQRLLHNQDFFSAQGTP